MKRQRGCKEPRVIAGRDIADEPHDDAQDVAQVDAHDDAQVQEMQEESSKKRCKTVKDDMQVDSIWNNK